MAIKISQFRPEKYVATVEGQKYFLADALASGDAAEIRDAIAVIAQARGVEALANEIGMSKQGLYKAIGKSGDPKLSTITKIVGALGLSLSVTTTT